MPHCQCQCRPAASETRGRRTCSRPASRCRPWAAWSQGPPWWDTAACSWWGGRSWGRPPGQAWRHRGTLCSRFCSRIESKLKLKHWNYPIKHTNLTKALTPVLMILILSWLCSTSCLTFSDVKYKLFFLVSSAHLPTSEAWRFVLELETIEFQSPRNTVRRRYLLSLHGLWNSSFQLWTDADVLAHLHKP